METKTKTRRYYFTENEFDPNSDYTGDPLPSGSSEAENTFFPKTIRLKFDWRHFLLGETFEKQKKYIPVCG